MQKMTPCLWFAGPLEEAADFYTGLFGGKVTNAQRMGDGPAIAMHIELFGQTVMLLAGRPPEVDFTDAVSFSVDCKDQAEVDAYWHALVAGGGAESMCGWCKDRFGVSWQIIPAALPKLLGGNDREGAGRAMQAMLRMKKIDVAALERAYAGA